MTQGIMPIMPQFTVTQGIVPQGIMPQGIVTQGVVTQGIVTQGIMPQDIMPCSLLDPFISFKENEVYCPKSCICNTSFSL
jgi:GLTT repeat (6 copies)